MNRKSILFASLILAGSMAHNTIEASWYFPGSAAIASSAKACLTFCQKMPKFALASVALVGIGYFICKANEKNNRATINHPLEVVLLHEDEVLQRLVAYLSQENEDLLAEQTRLNREIELLQSAESAFAPQNQPSAPAAAGTTSDIPDIIRLQQELRTAQAQVLTVQEQLSATEKRQAPMLQELESYKTLAAKNARQIQQLSLDLCHLQAKPT
jgi:hypothetical protein